MRLIQVTDCHLLADPKGRSRKGYPLHQLRAVLAQARALRPDMLLVTGDIAEDETSAAYRHAYHALAEVGAPWFWLPGNHDQPELMDEWQPCLDELDLGAWRVLLLNTRLSGQPGGEVGREQLQQLAEQLERDERPTLIALHHPPVPVGSVWMDAIGLADRDALWQTLAPYPQVRALLCGHIHQAFAAWEGMVAVYGCPSTSDQFLPGSHEFAVDEAARPGFRVIDLKGDDMTTWIERVEL
ncbi:metallophosphoesterase [Salinicola avicenniae]|uniref:metallophosphoesterase n=1 Tax=Salinicola avicenniae TaxID=2916836 RepID=UPI002073FCFC|nr:MULTISPECIES: metallophosphoesterase [unclassified Salinicola]